MKKTKTSSYVLTLKLNTDASDDAFLNKRFFLSCKIYNRLVSHVRKQLSKMLSDYRYRQLLDQWHKTRNSHDAEKNISIPLLENSLAGFVLSTDYPNISCMSMSKHNSIYMLRILEASPVRE